MAGRNRPDGELVAGMAALGKQIRSMRGRLSLERVAKAVGSSRSELSRVELGEKLPGPALADALDAFFGTEGDIRATRDALEGGGTAASVLGQYRRRWLHHFPAQFVGPVWTHVLPHPDRVDDRHILTIRWGPWTKVVEIESLPGEGVRLAYTKGDDGLSVPLFFDVSPAANLEHGVGEAATAADVNYGWTRPEDA